MTVTSNLVGKAVPVTVLLLATVAVIVAAAPPKWHQLNAAYTFQQYKRDFHKTYSDAEEDEMRRDLFHARLREILSHNAKEVIISPSH